jgi:hypothetical protein
VLFAYPRACGWEWKILITHLCTKYQAMYIILSDPFWRCRLVAIHYTQVDGIGSSIVLSMVSQKYVQMSTKLE